MWIFTPDGFYSVVEKPEEREAGMLTVRSRVKADLDVLRERFMPKLGPTISGVGTDYPYRAKIEKGSFSEGMKRISESVDYENFKHAVGTRQGYERARIYADVWRDLLRLEDQE
jgi:hypothetical protein